MSDPNAHVQSMVAAAVAGTNGESDAVKSAAVASAANAAVAVVPPPDSKTTSVLWIVLVGTLSAVVLISACIGGAYMLANHGSPPDTAVTFFSTALAALVGLFIQSPTNK